MLLEITKSINLILFKNSIRTIVNQSNRQQNFINDNLIKESSNQSSDQQLNQPLDESFKKSKKNHPFKNLYPWTNLTEFVDELEKRIIYNDNNLIAIDKPWGLAYHKVSKTLYKPYSFEALSQISGDPRFCLDNALPYLEERLHVEKLELIKSIDRHCSGVILLSTNEKAKPSIKKALQTNKVKAIPYLNFVCLAQGFPSIQGNELSESVRIKLRELDELADYKEPFITESKYRKQDIENGYLARVILKINSKNKFNSASCLSVSTNRLKWNFVRCYVAARAAFIIGDLRFSANVKRLLGEQVLETTNSFYKNNRIEPLNQEILKALKVRSNRKIPIMLHLNSLTLNNYKGKDVLISCNKLPDHFEFALKQLELEMAKNFDSSDQILTNQ